MQFQALKSQFSLTDDGQVWDNRAQKFIEPEDGVIKCRGSIYDVSRLFAAIQTGGFVEDALVEPKTTKKAKKPKKAKK